ncbi:MAG: molybdenum cofactor biosynthesis protein B [Phycisphaerales bacterium]
MSQSTNEHRAEAAGDAVGCAVLTISDTRTAETDKGGPLIRRLLEEAGHAVVDHAICRDEPAAISAQLDRWLAHLEVQAILTTGGTGIAKRDGTIRIVEDKLSVKLDGFGELFRMLSYDEVGAAAMLSRAVGGLVAQEDDNGGDTFIFAMPGSTNAIETAMRKLIAPELSHLVWERKK